MPVAVEGLPSPAEVLCVQYLMFVDVVSAVGEA